MAFASHLLDCRDVHERLIMSKVALNIALNITGGAVILQGASHLRQLRLYLDVPDSAEGDVALEIAVHGCGSQSKQWRWCGGA